MRGNAETTTQDYIKRRERTKSRADNNGRFASGSAQTPVAAASSHAFYIVGVRLSPIEAVGLSLSG